MKKKRLEQHFPPWEFKKLFCVMKLFFFFMLLSSNLVWAGQSYAQATSLNLDLNNVTLEEVFDAIRGQSEFEFFYNNDQVNTSVKVNVKAKNADIYAVLEQALPDIYEYKINDRYVLVNKRKEIAPVASSQLQQQTRKTITGTITDKDDVPIIGANIVEKGTTNGTVTDIDGIFSLQVDEEATLHISYIGYLSQDVNTGGLTRLNIVLNEDTQALDEVVVVGYGTQRKVNLTGAVGVVSGEDITSKATTDVLSAMQGQMPGVTILRSSGKPGSETGGTSSIRIRGFSSSNEAHPLVLIDGVEGNLQSLNSTDIESISVLKDAASASIYGARAAAGVILVTTKKGVQQRARVSYNGSFGVNTPGSMPQRIPVWEEIEIVNLLRMNNSGTPARNEEHTSWMSNPNISTTPNGARYTFQGNENWIAEGLNEYSTQQNHSVSVSGGSEKTQYFISGGYHSKNGLLKYGPDDFSRTNFRVSLNNEINNWVDFNVNASYEGTVQNENPYGAESIFGLLYNNLGWQTIYLPEDDTNYSINPYNTDYGRNPIRIMKEGGINRKHEQFVTGIATLRVKNIVEGLTLDLNASRRAGFYNEDREQPLLFATGRNGSERPGYHVNNPQSTDKTRRSNYQDKFEALLNYDLQIEDHHFHFLGGASYEEYLNDQIRGIARNGVSNNFFSFNFYDNSEANNSVLSDLIQPWKMASLFGRVNYNYANRYLLEATVRYDGSSRLAPGNRWGLFPSISGGWVISEEAFFEDMRSTVTNLKLRGSWGQLGNSTVLKDDYYPYIGLVTPGTFFGRPYYYQDQMISADITWETVTSTNIGVDLGFLNNKLSVTADYYWKKNNDMLSQATMGNLNGYPQNKLPFENVGILKVWGWEVSAQWRDRIGDLSYQVRVSLDDSKNELVSYQGASSIGAGTIQRLEGYPLKTIWGYETDGFWSSRQEYLDYKAANPGYESYDWDARLDGGDVRYVAQGNPDHRIGVGGGTPEDPGDLIYLGTENPRYLYGINLGIDWRGFDFSMFWQGVGNRKYVVNNQIFYPVNYDYRPHTELTRLGYWTEETPDAYFARLVEYQTYNYQVSDRWVQNGAYVRLKNIQLGYTIPVPENILQSLRVYISGNDVWEHTKAKFKALDPEVSNDKGRNYYPFFRTWSMGVSLTL